ncbi:MAG: MarR family transcriptional regulator [Candidatus Gracilibacteria bacterium]|nr:MarR family transcriptional regulator [Candidatus Gracilibacteria bacterium]
MSEKLKLSNQICFPFYAISRKIIKAYTPLLKDLDLTYPQYLVMLLLWENDNILIKDICDKLILETNTISPLLETLVKKGFISKIKHSGNNKEVFVSLTKKGESLKIKAETIPDKLLANYNIKNTDLIGLHKTIWNFLEIFE